MPQLRTVGGSTIIRGRFNLVGQTHSHLFQVRKDSAQENHAGYTGILLGGPMTTHIGKIHIICPCGKWQGTEIVKVTPHNEFLFEKEEIEAIRRDGTVVRAIEYSTVIKKDLGLCPHTTTQPLSPTLESTT
jgi:hypothetical protein